MVKFTVTTSKPDVPDLDAWMEQVVTAVVDRVKMRTPVKTGTLRDSIGFEKHGPESYEIGSYADYAVHIEFGTVHISPFAMFRTTLNEIETIANSVPVKTKQ